MKLKDMSLLRTQAHINGAWVDAANGETFDVHNPATGQKLGAVPNMGEAETGRAVEAAAAAFPAWAAKTAKERAAVLRRLFDLMMANQEDLAILMTAEQGKPLAESKGEIAYAASFIEWFAEEGKRLYGDVIPGHQPDKRILVLRQPVGVVAGITPWNFPAAMITRKAGPAPGHRCRLHVCVQASESDSALGARPGRTRGAGRNACGRVQCRYRQEFGGNRRRTDVESSRPKNHVHRFYSGR